MNKKKMISKYHINYKLFLIVEPYVNWQVKMLKINKGMLSSDFKQCDCKPKMKMSSISKNQEGIVYKITKLYNPQTTINACGKMACDSFIKNDCCIDYTKDVFRLCNADDCSDYLCDFKIKSHIIKASDEPSTGKYLFLNEKDDCRKAILIIFNRHVYSAEVMKTHSDELCENPEFLNEYSLVDSCKNDSQPLTNYFVGQEELIVEDQAIGDFQNKLIKAKQSIIKIELINKHIELFSSSLVRVDGKNQQKHFMNLNKEVNAICGTLTKNYQPMDMNLNTGPAGCGKSQQIIEKIQKFPKSFHFVSAMTVKAKDELNDKIGNLGLKEQNYIVLTSIQIIKYIQTHMFDDYHDVMLHIDECFLHTFGNIMGIANACKATIVNMYGDPMQIMPIKEFSYEMCNVFDNADFYNYFNIYEQPNSFTIPRGIMTELKRMKIYPKHYTTSNSKIGQLIQFDENVNLIDFISIPRISETLVMPFKQKTKDAIINKSLQNVLVNTIHESQGARSNIVIHLDEISSIKHKHHMIVALTRSKDINLISKKAIESYRRLMVNESFLKVDKKIHNLNVWAGELLGSKTVSIKTIEAHKIGTQVNYDFVKNADYLCEAQRIPFSVNWVIVHHEPLEKKFLCENINDSEFSIRLVPTIDMIDLGVGLNKLIQHNSNFTNMNIRDIAEVRPLSLKNKINVSFKMSSEIRLHSTVRDPVACFIPHNLVVKQSSADAIFDLEAVLNRCSVSGSSIELSENEVNYVVDEFFGVFIDYEKQFKIQKQADYDILNCISSKMMAKIDSNRSKYGKLLNDSTWQAKCGISIVKDQMKFTSDMRGVTTGKCGQTTIPSPPMIQLAQMFNASACTAMLDYLLKDKYQIVVYCDDEFHFQDFVSKIVLNRKTQLVLTDFETMDASRSLGIIQIVIAILLRLYYPRDQAYFLYQTQIKCKIEGKNYSLKTIFANTAGHPFTLLWNIITTMVMTMMNYDMDNCIQAIFKGDDSCNEFSIIDSKTIFSEIYEKIKYKTKTQIVSPYKGEIFEFCHLLSDGITVTHNVLYRFCKITGNVFKDSTDLPLRNRIIQYQQSMSNMLSKHLTMYNIERMIAICIAYYDQEGRTLDYEFIASCTYFLLIFIKSRPENLIKHMQYNGLNMVSSKKQPIDENYYKSLWRIDLLRNVIPQNMF